MGENESQAVKGGEGRSFSNQLCFVYIVESPSPPDLLHGFVEGRVLTETLRLAGITSVYSLATNEETFAEALGPRLREQAYGEQKLPILHLSTHGSKEGIELTDGTTYKWHELRDLLLPINEGLGGFLLVCMSSCHGVHGCQMAMTKGDALPFAGIVGYEGRLSWSDAAVAFVTFYHRFFKDADLDQSVSAMRMAAGDEGFFKVSATYVREKYRRAAQAEQIKKALVELKKRTQGRV